MKNKLIIIALILISCLSLNSCVVYDTIDYEPIVRTHTIYTVPSYNTVYYKKYYCRPYNHHKPYYKHNYRPRHKHNNRPSNGHRKRR
jgi:hypothetical protein